MNMYLKIILLALIVLPELLFSQDPKAFKNDFYEAEYFFLNEHYDESAFLYQQLLKTDTSNYNLHFLLGASYLSVQTKKIRAIPHLEKAVANMSPGYREGNWKERNAPRQALFALAKAYHVANRFDEAIDLYKKYYNVMGTSDAAESEYVQQQIASAELARKLARDTLAMNYSTLEDSFFKDCYRAVLAERDSIMVFMTDKPFYSPVLMSKRKNGRWSDPEILNDKLKIDGNYNLCSISYDGTELYIAMEKDFNWDIYISYFENGRWTPVQALNKDINSEFNETHASITPDKKRLFFTSDRPGGMGAMDIYYSDRDPDADWQKPVNIGKPINSIFSEETPFSAADGDILYFSSKGHETMGGFDIYFSNRLPDNGWSSPVNIGYPLNTADDDLFL
ncbi:MAG: PD40 domain-containing protein, partial [Bacteroidales bacterium]|nr:PD40 domain-containing protein [Bacteroidales bacterium]